MGKISWIINGRRIVSIRITYRKNVFIFKILEFVPDYSALAKYTIKETQKMSRPHTAFARWYFILDKFFNKMFSLKMNGFDYKKYFIMSKKSSNKKDVITE